MTGGVRLAGLAVGGALGAMAKSKWNGALAGCQGGDPTKCSPAAISEGSTASGLATGSTVGFVVGGAALAAGVVVFLTSPGPRASSSARWELSPVVGPGGASAPCGGGGLDGGNGAGWGRRAAPLAFPGLGLGVQPKAGDQGSCRASGPGRERQRRHVVEQRFVERRFVEPPPPPSSSSGGCGDTTGSAANCGACGHSCNGGQCLMSQCLPVDLTTGKPGAIAVDDTSVYWTHQPLPTNASIMVSPKTGGNGTSMADATMPTAIALDANMSTSGPTA